jgi:SulP family sulfate permease
MRYSFEDFSADLKAGFITAIVALPLAIAFAIASGATPIMGLYTAIIAGILGSAFGGSKFSITGPTGAMAVIILAITTKFGLEGLLLAGFLAGTIQILFGVLKVGKMVKYIPLPVIVGFTAGIGAIIFIGQISNFFGLVLSSKEKVWETIADIFVHLNLINWIAVVIAVVTICLMVFIPKISSKIKVLANIPPSLFALLISAFAVFLLDLAVPTIGVIPNSLPTIKMINFNWSLLLNVLPSAFTIALLGVIEALLCAVVCDGMTGTKHNSNKELFGQGICNVVLPFFGAIPSTAAIARSAVNVREGARTKMAGIYHAIIIALIVFIFSPLAKFIPKAFLAGVLMVVSFRMINLKEIKTVFSMGILEGSVLSITLILTVLTDLVFAVQVGMLLSFFLLFVTLTKITNVKSMEEYDEKGEINSLLKENRLDDKVSVYTIHGPFFFGAINIFEEKISEHMNAKRPTIIIRMKHVPFVDSTALVQLIGFLKSRKKSNSKVLFTEFWPGVAESLYKNEEFAKLVPRKNIYKDVKTALKDAHKIKS